MKKLFIPFFVLTILAIYGCSTVKEPEKKQEPAANVQGESISSIDSIDNVSQEEAARKALEYLNGERTYENHQKAYQWAQKADSATKAKVIQRLKDVDFPIP